MQSVVVATQLIELGVKLAEGPKRSTDHVVPLEVVPSTVAEPELDPVNQHVVTDVHDIDAIELIEPGWPPVTLQDVPPELVNTSGVELVGPTT